MMRTGMGALRRVRKFRRPTFQGARIARNLPWSPFTLLAPG